MFSRKRRQEQDEGGDPVADTPGAVLAAAVSAMVGDGEVNEAELLQLSTLCALSPIFAKISAGEINARTQAIVRRLSAEGHEAVIRRAAAQLSPRLRETAFAFAARIVVADGVINDEEVAAVNALGRWLEIDIETGRKILDVMRIMQRGPEA